MIITLEDFEFANGYDRIHQMPSEETLELEQNTQTAMPSRGAWKVAFPDRAMRCVRLSYRVIFPPCATLEDAMMQSRTLWASCPRGGVLIEYHAGVRITYPKAWVNGVIRCERLGVRNIFTFPIEATDPTAEELVLDSDGEIFTDGTDDEEFTY